MPVKLKYDIPIQVIFDTAISCGGSLAKTATALGMPYRSTVGARLKKAGLMERMRAMTSIKPKPGQKIAKSAKEKLTINERGQFTEVDYVGDQINTAEELLLKSGIDMELYEVERITVNNWEVAGAKPTSGIWKTGLKQIKVQLRRKRDERVAVDRVLQKLEDNSPITLKIKYPKDKKQKARRALEVSIMDPHYGMQCYKGESDHNWSLEECSRMCLWAIDSLLAQAHLYGKFEEIVFPFGNDFLHHDNAMHTTTRGTLQPEGLSFQHVYENAIKLAVTMVDKLTALAPVRIIQVSGNHDQQASFSLGQVLKAYYRNNDNVTVDVSPSPYKFYRFGTNLIGFDHGHHIKSIRLAALMAHECREHWADTSFREWHLGDQHRKGTGSPVVMEEQGVGVEYLPALTPPNAWHRLKGFNWQQRGAMAFVWDHDTGPVARLQVNLNSYTGKPTGVGFPQKGK